MRGVPKPAIADIGRAMDRKGVGERAKSDAGERMIHDCSGDDAVESPFYLASFAQGVDALDRQGVFKDKRDRDEDQSKRNRAAAVCAGSRFGSRRAPCGGCNEQQSDDDGQADDRSRARQPDRANEDRRGDRHGFDMKHVDCIDAAERGFFEQATAVAPHQRDGAEEANRAIGREMIAIAERAGHVALQIVKRILVFFFA